MSSSSLASLRNASWLGRFGGMAVDGGGGGQPGRNSRNGFGLVVMMRAYRPAVDGEERANVEEKAEIESAEETDAMDSGRLDSRKAGEERRLKRIGRDGLKTEQGPRRWSLATRLGEEPRRQSSGQAER